MKDLSTFDLKNEFYEKTTPVGDLQTCGIEDLAQYAEFSIAVSRSFFSSANFLL